MYGIFRFCLEFFLIFSDYFCFNLTFDFRFFSEFFLDVLMMFFQAKVYEICFLQRFTTPLEQLFFLSPDSERLSGYELIFHVRTATTLWKNKIFCLLLSFDINNVWLNATVFFFIEKLCFVVFLWRVPCQSVTSFSLWKIS